MTLCYLALGSNLRSPHRQLSHAINALRQLPRTCIQTRSCYYHTKPMGIRAQPDFLNMAIALHTTLSPQQLLYHCKMIEQKHRRIHKKVWGARTLDIDIILFGQQHVRLPTLNIPHPELLKRDFVIVPLLEIAPNLRLPTGEYLAQYAPSHYTWIRKIMK